MGHTITVARVQADIAVIDPHCAPVVPGHDLRSNILPNGNLLLTLLTYQIEPDGRTVAVVTCRVEWEPAILMAAHKRLLAVMEAGVLGQMAPKNAMAS